MSTLLWLIYLFLVNFLFQHSISFRDFSNCTEACSFVISSCWYGYLYRCNTQSLGSSFSGSGFPVFCSAIWHSSSYKVLIPLQELMAVVDMCKMAFWLSGNMVSLHLDNDTAKAYICIQSGTISSFSFLTNLLLFNLADKHGINLIAVYIHACSFNVESNSLMEKVGSRVAPVSFHGSGSISTLGSAEVRALAILTYQSVSALLHLGKSTISWSLWLNAFNHLRTYHVGYMCFLLLSKFP